MTIRQAGRRFTRWLSCCWVQAVELPFPPPGFIADGALPLSSLRTSKAPDRLTGGRAPPSLGGEPQVPLRCRHQGGVRSRSDRLAATA